MSSRRIQLIILAAVLALAAGLGVKLILDRGDSEPDERIATVETENTENAGAEASGAPFGPLGDLARRVDGDPHAMGDVDAPIVIVEFADYRCPFCAKFSQDIQPELIDRYVDTGKVRFEWRDLPIFGEQSLLAARAGQAAADQGRFWQFTDAVFADAPQTGHADLTVEKLRGFAEAAGVRDIDRFVREMNGDVHNEAIQMDSLVAQGFGISSTPAFSVHGHPVLGAHPVDTFTQLIDHLLAEM